MITPLNQPWMHSPAVSSIFLALDHKVRFVGGCIRDALLGHVVKDIDLACQYTPDIVTKKLTEQGIKVVPTGIDFGTVTAVINSVAYEITSLRQDIATDGRHATVSYTEDFALDAMRRDFTINALSCDQDGTIYDYTKGLEDIKGPVIRFVGDAGLRCQEDALRILRYYRFLARFPASPNQEAQQACTKHAALINHLSGERIGAEMLKCITMDNPTLSLKAMTDTGCTPYVFGNTPMTFDNFKRYLEIEHKHQLPIMPIVRLIALTHDHNNLSHIKERWKLCKKHIKSLQILMKNPCTPDLLLQEHKTRILELDKHRYLEAILGCIAITNDEGLANIYQKLKHWEIPTFPINGQDLIEHCGYTPGKALGNALKAAKKWWIESGYQGSKNDVLTYVKKNIIS